jgi:hypothetical protein
MAYSTAGGEAGLRQPSNSRAPQGPESGEKVSISS